MHVHFNDHIYVRLPKGTQQWNDTDLEEDQVVLQKQKSGEPSDHPVPDIEYTPNRHD